ncbi:hypothetical protein HYV88_00385 [Candidatus Woesearchaeota archaeon]|nr:hypothetical protein [Candidatus Woesearchaeota archaeon]
MELKTLEKNIYDLQHQKLINSSNILHIILATIIITFLFTDLSNTIDADLVLLIKFEAVMVFIILVFIMKLVFDSKFKELEIKLNKLKE